MGRSARSAWAYIDGEYVFNPTASEMENSKLDLRVAGTADAILMVEAGASIVSEELVLEGLKRAHEAMQDIIRVQVQMREELGKPKFEFIPAALSEDVRAKVVDAVGTRVLEAMSSGQHQRRALLRSGGAGRVPSFPAWPRTRMRTCRKARCARCTRRSMRSCAGRSGPRSWTRGVRPDMRTLKEIRPISVEVGLLPRAHGSGLFTPRRNAGVDHHHPGHGRRRAEAGRPGIRNGQALHAPLQLPAVFDGRDGVHARTRPSRDRPRRIGPSGRSCR